MQKILVQEKTLYYRVALVNNGFFSILELPDLDITAIVHSFSSVVVGMMIAIGAYV
jgi:hypothetical protein